MQQMLNTSKMFITDHAYDRLVGRFGFVGNQHQAILHLNKIINSPDTIFVSRSVCRKGNDGYTYRYGDMGIIVSRDLLKYVSIIDLASKVRRMTEKKEYKYSSETKQILFRNRQKKKSKLLHLDDNFDHIKDKTIRKKHEKHRQLVLNE